MDCNKDEAIRAKELAEKKLAEMDAAGAKRFAVKAQNLYPELDGLPQLLATLDLYIAADKKINGETDWYSVIGVQPSADEDTIRKHYKKLALILHPDKNKSVGADGAFKVLSEAWNLLSDKGKRVAYDQKRNLRATYTSVFNGKASSSVPSSNTVFHSFSNNSMPNTSAKSGSSYSRSAPPHSARNGTFWTSCCSCKMHFEYSREYVNLNLSCSHCSAPFLAVETPAPPINGNSRYIPLTDLMQRQKFSQLHNKGGGRFSGLHSSTKFFQKGAFSGSGSNINITPPASFTAQAAGVTHTAGETLKSGHKESQTGTMREESPFVNICPQKTDTGMGTRSSGSTSSFAVKKHRPKKWRIDETEMKNHVTMGKEGVGISSFESSGFETGKMNIAGISRTNSMKEPSQPKIRNILMEMAKKEIFKNLNPRNPAPLSNSSNKPKASEKGMEEKDEGNGKDAPSMKADGHQSREFKDIKSSIQPKKSYIVDADVAPGTKEPDPMSMNVPDPDFHDFDKDRTEKSFGENQVWAAYDDDDGMPRYYAMIHSVISLKPFKMRMSWLNSKSNMELAPLNWIGSGFYKTSGDFWIGKHEVNRFLNSFSHKVKWSKGRRVIQIYPRKGDVWALYRNWSSDWNELTLDEVIHKYDMVEVLEDYNEQNGVAVAPLVKVPGFKTVFRKHSKSSITWMTPKEELFRFSHQVPSYLLTGQEGHNAPKGGLELDPAATPLELLQVFTEAQVTEMEVNFERALGETVLGDSQRCEGEEITQRQQRDHTKGVGEAAMEEEIKKEKENKKTGMLVYNRRQRRKQES